MDPLERWHEEKQSAWIYRIMARIESDAARAHLFEQLAGAAEDQAEILRGDVKQGGADVPAFVPSLRALVVTAVARRLGVRASRHMLTALKIRGLSVYDAPLGGHAMPVSRADVGARHRRPGAAGSLRAAVFGASDGVVSNTSLILGVAGAAPQDSWILLAGVAGMLAGAFSMAAGEYVSMRSQRELYEHQIAEERDELERYPAEEAEELALIYNARGIPMDEARHLTRNLVKEPERALDTLAREELGLNPADLGSPWGAALASFVAFALGALVPILPFVFVSFEHKIAWACGLAGAALFAVGATLSLFSGKSAWFGGLRMLAIGALAGAATFGIGKLLGVSLW